MDEPRGRFARLLPPEQGASRRTMLLSFGLWPVAMLLTLRGHRIGLGGLGLVAIPLCVTAFKRLRDVFPPGPTRRVVTGYGAAYMLVVAWVLILYSGPFALLVVAFAAATSIRVLSRTDEDGRSVIESMVDRAALDAGTRRAPGPDGDALEGPAHP